MSSYFSERPTTTWETPLLQPNEAQYRTEQLKQSLASWRNVLLPLNNLLQWEQNYHPLIIFTVLTSIFILIRQVDPSALTLGSCLVLIYALADLWGASLLRVICQNEEGTSVNDEKYARLCERIAQLEQYAKNGFQSVRKMRRERPMMYLIVGGILLIFLAVCGQRIDNLLLTYLTMLVVCLLPGVLHQQSLQRIPRMISGIWNEKLSSETKGAKSQ